MRDDKLLFSLIAKKFKRSFPKKSFISGTSSVPVSGKVFDEKEMINGVEAVLDGWWTEGRFAESFERKFRDRKSVV